MPNIPFRLFNALYWVQEHIRAGRNQMKSRKAQKGGKSSTSEKSAEKRVKDSVVERSKACTRHLRGPAKPATYCGNGNAVFDLTQSLCELISYMFFPNNIVSWEAFYRELQLEHLHAFGNPTSPYYLLEKGVGAQMRRIQELNANDVVHHQMLLEGLRRVGIPHERWHSIDVVLMKLGLTYLETGGDQWDMCQAKLLANWITGKELKPMADKALGEIFDDVPESIKEDILFAMEALRKIRVKERRLWGRVVKGRVTRALGITGRSWVHLVGVECKRSKSSGKTKYLFGNY
ncbi:hypothetical protein BZA77DRAFT_376531 [Pyronema omphalodes]|nr:hypothetical protein BZA77DRAFT_376531 [Pyronema omphalodes]